MNVKLRNSFASNNAKRTIALLLSVSLVGVLFAGLGVLSGSPAFATATYDNVQVLAQTTNITEGTFTFAAYNSTGSLVSSTQTIYPAAGFELPTGEYLFTVTAENETQVVPTPIPLVGEGASAGSSTGSTSPTVIPIPFQYPDIEYGFLLQQISGPVTLNIKTVPIENITLTKVSVKLQFVNGTAVAGASVSASVVGAWYWWYGPAANLRLSAVTGSDGMANLTVPAVPVDVTAWDWIKVNITPNATTIPVNIGGETINITVYWNQIYVGLGGSSLVIPPQNSTTITLHVQDSSYWYMPADQVSGAPTPSVASVPTNTASSGSISDGTEGVPASISVEYSSDSSSSTPTIQDQVSPITETLSPGTTTQNPTTTAQSTEAVTQNPTTSAQTTAEATQSPVVTNPIPAVATTKGSSDLLLIGIAAAIAAAFAITGLGIAIRRGRKNAA